MIDEGDISTWPGIPPDVLKYIENEAVDLYVSAEKVSHETEMDVGKAYWAVVMLYTNFYNKSDKC